jgi:hypothetical protein
MREQREQEEDEQVSVHNNSLLGEVLGKVERADQLPRINEKVLYLKHIDSPNPVNSND